MDPSAAASSEVTKAETPERSSGDGTALDPARNSSEKKPGPPRQHRKHRRTSSEDLGRTYDQTSSYYQYPPSQISYYPMNGANGVHGMNGMNGAAPQPGPPPEHGQMPMPPGHHRVRSWSENVPFVPAQGYQYPPSPGGYMHHNQAYSPSGNPLVPMFADPNLPPNAPTYMTPQKGQHSGSSRRQRRQHRRTHSTPLPSYGAVNNNLFHSDTTPPPPNGPPPPLPSGRRRDFSPRTEIMKLTAGMGGRTPQGSASPKRSPSGVPGSPMVSLHGASPFPTANEMRVSFSPARTPPEYGGAPNGPTVPFVSDSDRGEAVFAAQRKDKHRKSPSNRMHMRQKSAQLFMEDFKGQEQVPSCRDIFFLMFFVFHIIGIVYLGNTYGYEAVRSHDELEDDLEDSSVTIIYSNVIYVASLSGVFAVTISALTLLLMSALAKKMVQIALIVAISLSFAWGTIGIGLSPKKIVPATGVIALVLSVAYSFIVWDRIPFAAANLDAGLTGIKANPGAVVIAFFFQFLALGWSIYFTYVTIGVYDAMEVGDLEVSVPELKILVYCALAISYYWTLHVFLNIVQVTVSGVIGSWWFTTDGDTTTRKDDLKRAFFRSSFYAIGSICYGSLVVGPVRLLRQLSVFFRPNEEVPSLMCLHECCHCIQKCITSCVDSLADRYSPWGFTYVGLYGYSLVDAGLHSTELFAKRGWTTIVSDDLVPNVLLMTSLVIGGATGCFAHLIENFEALSLTTLDEPVATSFLVGVLVGLVVSSVLFGIISSSVNAVIVCFAASPVDFEANHPNLSQEMRTAWREVWPGAMDAVDMRVAVAAYLGNDETHPLLA